MGALLSSAAAVLGAMAPPTQDGPTPWRYELGARVRALEADFLAAPRAARGPVLTDVEQAVWSFFRGDVGGAAERLDLARVTLGGRAPHGATALAPWFEQRAVAAGTPVLVLRVDVLPNRVPPDGGTLWLRWRSPLDSGGGGDFAIAPPGAPSADWGAVLGKVPGGFAVATPASPGRWVAELALVDAEGAALLRRLDLDVLERPAERVEAARVGWATLKPAPGLERDTALGLLAIVQGLLEGAQPETRVDSGAYLARAEELLARAERGGRLGAADTGDQRLQRRQRVARFFAPEVPAGGGSRPLVLALHGAGGSENLFFDGHGGGLAVELARERGWFVLAPRLSVLGGGDLAGWLDEVSDRWPVDRARVFVVGHSMGGAAALSELARAPSRYRAAAILGGGGRASAEHLSVPLLIAAGERDFGLAGARRLAADLGALGHRSVTLATMRDAEHLLVVPLALPASFAHFDGFALGAPR